MLRLCVKTVFWQFIKTGKVANLTTIYTNYSKYLASQVLFKLSLFAGFEQFFIAFKQPVLGIFNPLLNFFPTLSTTPNTTNEYIRGLINLTYNNSSTFLKH